MVIVLEVSQLMILIKKSHIQENLKYIGLMLGVKVKLLVIKVQTKGF